MSEKIDWSKAPEGATHYVPAPNDLHHPIWLKMDGNTVLNAGYIGHKHWAHSYTSGSQPCTDLSNAIKRPITPSWSGEGLPPVGVVCEVRNAPGGWGKATIKYQGKGVTVWLWDRPDGNTDQVEFAGCPDLLEFRPIRTPEQIAADERQKMADMLWQRYLQPILAPAQEAQVKTALGLIYDDFYRKP